MRPLSRWHAVGRTGPRVLLVAVATAFAMVGALILEPGISARTPDETMATDGQRAATSAPDAALTLEMPASAQTSGSLLDGSDSAAPAGSPRAPMHAFVPSIPAASPSPASDPFAIAPWISGILAMAPPVYLWHPDVPVPPSTGLADQSDLGSALSPAMTSSLPGAVADAAVSPFRASTAISTATGTATRVPTQRAKPRSAAQRSSPAATTPVVSAGAWNVAPIVTWYGPGFYNHRTACGQRYTRTIIGFASRTLPCGTLVQFRWHGMTAVAPVIDRGPYASPAYVFDWSAALACDVFKPHGVKNSCFTRYRVQWRVVKRRH